MSALVVFSVDVRRLATFYEAVLGNEGTQEPSGDIRLVSEREEILLHSMPDKIAQTVEMNTPPVARDGSAIKPVFDVESLDTALRCVEEAGGVVTNREFTVNGLTRHDVIDPDGNVIQLRSPAS